MDNLSIYKSLSEVPAEAKREINAGRLKGKTDINPMWRLKALTAQFGPCGIGWKYEITRQWLENGAKGEISAFCNILLYIKLDGEWSAGIPGTGGSAFVASEKNGPYTSDECYKMALTDALSVACKALGVAASVYWDKDPTKYTEKPQVPEKKSDGIRHKPLVCSKCGAPITAMKLKSGKELKAQDVADIYGVCLDCLKKEKEAEKAK